MLFRVKFQIWRLYEIIRRKMWPALSSIFKQAYWFVLDMMALYRELADSIH